MSTKYTAHCGQYQNVRNCDTAALDFSGGNLDFCQIAVILTKKYKVPFQIPICVPLSETQFS